MTVLDVYPLAWINILSQIEMRCICLQWIWPIVIGSLGRSSWLQFWNLYTSEHLYAMGLGTHLPIARVVENMHKKLPEVTMDPFQDNLIITLESFEKQILHLWMVFLLFGEHNIFLKWKLFTQTRGEIPRSLPFSGWHQTLYWEGCCSTWNGLQA